jgi:hypothetical protein
MLMWPMPGCDSLDSQAVDAWQELQACHAHSCHSHQFASFFGAFHGRSGKTDNHSHSGIGLLNESNSDYKAQQNVQVIPMKGDSDS